MDVLVTARHFVFGDRTGDRRFVMTDEPDLYAVAEEVGIPVNLLKRVTPVEADGGDGRWFVVYVEDCFDPPLALVRAENEMLAEEMFADALDWAHVTEPDLADYEPEQLSHNSDGVPYESDNICVFEVWLKLVVG